MLGNLTHRIRAAVSVGATIIIASAAATVSNSNPSSSESKHISAESRSTDNVQNHCCYNLYSREIKKIAILLTCNNERKWWNGVYGFWTSHFLNLLNRINQSNMTALIEFCICWRVPGQTDLRLILWVSSLHEWQTLSFNYYSASTWESNLTCWLKITPNTSTSGWWDKLPSAKQNLEIFDIYNWMVFFIVVCVVVHGDLSNSMICLHGVLLSNLLRNLPSLWGGKEWCNLDILHRRQIDQRRLWISFIV